MFDLYSEFIEYEYPSYCKRAINTMKKDGADISSWQSVLDYWNDLLIADAKHGREEVWKFSGIGTPDYKSKISVRMYNLLAMTVDHNIR